MRDPELPGSIGGVNFGDAHTPIETQPDLSLIGPE